MDDESRFTPMPVPALVPTPPTDAITGWLVDHPPLVNQTTGLPYPIPLPTELQDEHGPTATSGQP